MCKDATFSPPLGTPTQLTGNYDSMYGMWLKCTRHKISASTDKESVFIIKLNLFFFIPFILSAVRIRNSGPCLETIFMDSKPNQDVLDDVTRNGSLHSLVTEGTTYVDAFVQLIIKASP
jgi:hypothetical protein